MKPVIGVTGGVGAAWAQRGTTFSSYARVIENAGGHVVPLGHGRHGKLEDCDGLFVPGGWDVHPKYMGPLPGDENLTPEQVAAKYNIETEKMRDEVEIRLIHEALAAGKPYFGICRGFQILNIVVGRLLIGDILTWKPGSLQHQSNADGTSESHEITIEPDSVIERCYGSKPITVNSRHHQGLTPEFVSDKFRITAMAPDGIVEAVEMKAAPFVVGVQWHPEKQADDYIHSISGALFQAFVDACASWRQSN